MLFSNLHTIEAKDKQLLACEEENGREVSTKKGLCTVCKHLCIMNMAFQEQKCTLGQYRHALHRKSGTFVLCIQYSLWSCLLN